MKTIKIFIASSGELSEEREESVSIVSKINKLYPDLKLEPIKWETDIPSGSYDKNRVQDEINPLLGGSEIVLLIIYSRLGRFTFEEYELAKTEKKKIFIYFKTGFSPVDEEEINNFTNVIKFKEKIKQENQLLPKEFNNIDQFRNIVKDDLNLYLSKRKQEKDTSPIKTSHTHSRI